MSFEGLVRWVDGWFLGYYFLLNLSYLVLTLVSLLSLLGYLRSLAMFPATPESFLPLSILVPAYNEREVIVSSVRSLLNLDYPEFEVVVINDGSTDGTMELLREAFHLLPMEMPARVRLKTRPVRAVHRSFLHPRLLVLDKENGSKADALNAGINFSSYPLICTVDADSLLDGQALHRVVAPFLSDASTVASGGIVRVLNGCRIREGRIEEVALPRSLLGVMQVLEYARAFLSGRSGWSLLGSFLVVSGAFSVFRKEAVVEVGGYIPGHPGEDMELVVRLHRRLREAGKPYRIVFLPDPVCWTQVPEDLPSLLRQRDRWQRGLLQSLWEHRAMLLHPRYGSIGWLGFPFFLLFEALGPLVEVAGLIWIAALHFLDLLAVEFARAYFLLVIAYGWLLSLSAVMLDDLLFRRYERVRDLLKLAFLSPWEYLGYHQLLSLWRARSLFRIGERRWGKPLRKPVEAGAEERRRAVAPSSR